MLTASWAISESLRSYFCLPILTFPSLYVPLDLLFPTLLPLLPFHCILCILLLSYDLVPSPSPLVFAGF